MLFHNRYDAGRRLAEMLKEMHVEADLVLAIPRGGVPIGAAVAETLGAELDVIEAEKLGAPFNPELAIGAVAAGGTVWLNEPLIRDLRVGSSYVEEIKTKKARIAEERAGKFRSDRPAAKIEGRRVILVDDGIATGATMRACLRQVAKDGAESVILAVPVAPSETRRRFEGEADEIHIVEAPVDFAAVGQFYRDFSQTSDEEVMELLRKTHHGTDA